MDTKAQFTESNSSREKKFMNFNSQNREAQFIFDLCDVSCMGHVIFKSVIFKRQPKRQCSYSILFDFHLPSIWPPWKIVPNLKTASFSKF